MDSERYQKRGLPYDPRARGLEALNLGAYSAPALQGRALQVRPGEIGGGDLAVDAWNIVKSSAPGSTFDVTSGTKGPIETFYASSQEELWIHFAQPIPSDSGAALMLTLGNFRRILGASASPAGAGYLYYAAMGADWNPATLTWSNKPSTVASQFSVDQLQAVQEVSRETYVEPVVGSANLTSERMIQIPAAGSVNVYGLRLYFAWQLAAVDNSLKLDEVVSARFIN